MTENQNPVTPPEQQEPLIPPIYMLVIGLGGLFVALIVGISQPEFGVIGFGALGVGALSLLAWALLSPQQAISVFTGRTARFGGVSLLVTAVVLVALVVVYIFARNQEIHIDLTQGDIFSLTQESRDAIAPFASDPNVPRIRILAFFSASQTDARDQVDLLLTDYQEASGGKIDYQLIDIDRQPGTATLYGITSSGQAVVVKDNPALVGQPVVQDPAAAASSTDSAFNIQTYQPDETGFTADVDNAQTITSITQQDVTNAILRVAADGDFKAYFLTVADGMSTNMTYLRQLFEQGFGWTVQDLTLISLLSPESEVTLNDPNLDGEVVILPGGSAALSAEELGALETFLNNGGDLVIYAGNSFNESLTSLATDPALNDYLFSTFGVRVNNDVVLDNRQALQSIEYPYATDFDVNHPITSGFAGAAVVFPLTHSISISDSLPPNVSVTALARSSENSWVTSDLQGIVDGSYQPADDVVKAPTVLAAAAENATTGARLVVIGSEAAAIDDLLTLENANNYDFTLSTYVWITNFDSFARQVTVEQPTRPQDQPLFISQQQLRDINLLTVFILPFGILAIGVYVWWANRERRRS